MTVVDVIIEIEKGGHIKYEYDKEKDMLICDRILHTPMKYPFNYGFILNTLSEDGDPLDVVILMDDPLIPGSIIKCKILGYLDTKDDAGNDPKIIVCPLEKVDPMWKNIDSLFCQKIDEHKLEKIRYFFQHYKDLENKTVSIGHFYDTKAALIVYKQAIERFKYSNNNTQKKKITDFFDRI